MSANRIEREIEQLTEIRDQLTRHIKALKEHHIRLTNGAPQPRNVNEVVSRIQLKPYVEIWLNLHRKQYDTNGYQALSDASKVSVSTIKDILGLRERGMAQRTVELTTADKLLQAMNMTHVLHELDIFDVKMGEARELPEPPFTHYEED